MDESDQHVEKLASLWRGYAEKVYGQYSPLNSAIADTVARDRELLGMVRDAPPHAHDPNMLMAVVQYLVMGGLDHPMADLYSDFDPELDLAPLIADLWKANRAEVDGLMAERHIQTNETGRTAMLALGVAHAAAVIGEPIALVDAGASAGLNLVLDEYLLDYGPLGSTGPDDSPVRIFTEVRGRIPDVALGLPRIQRRVGLDADPVDLTKEKNVRWLMACIWPGTGRHERAAAALELASARPSLVRRGDMVEDLASILEEMAPLPTVVVTSFSMAYLLSDQREQFRQVLRSAAQSRPIGWVFADSVGVVDLFSPTAERPEGELVPAVLGLAVLEGDRIDARSLAYVQPHGAWVSWLDIPT